jgi:SAM-dependent methyltransferase
VTSARETLALRLFCNQADAVRQVKGGPMALLKIYSHVRERGLWCTLKKMLRGLPQYLSGLHRWELRRCQCCDRFSLFLASNRASGEYRTCLFCSANERYELLALEIKSRYGEKISEKDVLELAPYSPLGRILSRARTYTRSFYEAGRSSGFVRTDGTVCADITALSFDNDSFDLIVSAEVLEHVPFLDKAFSESARVLRPGGAHLFTVPPGSRTRKQAEVVGGEIRHIEVPEYHRDPMSPHGILAFWDIGPDLPEVIPCPNLNIRIVRGPAGRDARVVWIAERSSPS